MPLGDGNAAPQAPRGDVYRTSTSVHERSMHVFQPHATHPAAAAHHNQHNHHKHQQLHDHHAAAVARLRAVSGLHGRRLACFRPRQRFSLRPLCRAAAAVGDHGVCACAHEPLQCRLVMASRETAPSELNGAQLRHADLARRKKWVDKFEAHDWDKHARFVCQKWRENQKKIPRRQRSGKNKGKEGMSESAVLVDTSACTDDEQEIVEQQDPQQQKTSPSRVVKNALTSFASAAEVMVQTSKFDALLRAGVPPQLRGQVWWLCSGAAQKRAAAGPAETYAALVRKIPMLSKRAALEIEKDLPRTFPNSDTPPLTRDESEAHATSMRELRRVLQAYCLRNPCVGYCQSMNFLAAVLLQYLEEEEAFWVLVVMVEDLIPQFHSKSMLGSRAEQRVFGELVQLKLPQVYEHMQALGVDLEPFTLKWFLCLFLNTLPLEPVMRVWDVFFCEGSHVLLRVGLALLKLSQPRILACDDAIDVYEMFNFSHETLLEITAPHRNGMLNRDECVCDTLVRLAMDKSFIGTIAFDSLHELRHLYRNEVAEEVKAADERRALRESASRRPAPAASVESSNSSDDADVDEEDEETFHLRHVEAEQELQEYDFVEEYAYHIGDVSPTKYIHFNEIRGGSAASSSTASSEEIFVDVDYDGADGPRTRASRPC